MLDRVKVGQERNYVITIRFLSQVVAQLQQMKQKIPLREVRCPRGGTGVHSKEDHSKGDHSKEGHSKGDHSKGDHSEEDRSKEDHSKEDHSKETDGQLGDSQVPAEDKVKLCSC